jgi:hypothetical protein
MSENKTPSLPFLGSAMFLELTPEEAAAYQAKLDKQKEERRARDAEKIKTLPEAQLSLEEKRARAGEILDAVTEAGLMPEGRLAAMTEDELNAVIVAAADWEEACNNFDDDAFEAAMAADRAAMKTPTPKP